MSRIYLHDEIKDILLENSNRWMKPEEIAHFVNGRGLFKRTARAKTQDVLKKQITRRVRKRERSYSNIFEEDASGRIRLKIT